MGLLRQPTSDITKGVIWKQLLAFFFPLWFGTFFQQLYNTVDTLDRKSTRLNSSHIGSSRMPSSA